MFTSVPLDVFANESNTSEQKDTAEERINSEDHNQNVEEMESPAPETEMVEERTENSKLFDNGDGTFTKNIYFDPVHIEENGELTEVSTNLLETTLGNEKVIETENTLLTSTFYEEMKNGEYAVFERDNASITFSILEAAGKDRKVKVTDVNPVFNENSITHKGIFPDIDLRNMTFNENVKEDIVLHSYKGLHTFTFHLKTELNGEVLPDGSVAFYKKKEDKPAFVLPEPFMTDSNIDELSSETARSDNVTYDLEKTEDGYFLTVTADEEWLKDPDRVYPVYIDPTTSLTTNSDAFVMSAYPKTNYGTATKKWDASQKQYVLKIGKYDNTTGTNYAFLKQNISKINKAVIDSATLNVYVTHAYYGSKKNGLWLDEVTGNWSSSSLTWNNKPGSKNIGNVNAGRDEWVRFNVLHTVKAWASGKKTNYGFKLHANGNGKTHWKKIVSSDNSTLKPYLSVTYHYEAPPAPKVTAVSNGTGTGTGHLNINWNKVPGSTGYKVLLFNGKNYQAFHVGNVTNWSTKGKKIWPTNAQIAAGAYALKTNKTGTELAFNPNPVYKNAAADGGTYPNARNYWVRIVAVYPGGDSPQSAATRSYMPMEVPKAPTGRPYANAMNEKSGYVKLNWEAVDGADGYKIGLYNGKEYQEVATVGKDTLSWSTQNKGLWTTKAQIAAGEYKLNVKGGGAELAVDPSPVYRNSKGAYPKRKNYWFRVKAYSKAGHTESNWSGAFTPTIPGAEDFLGMEDYWTEIDVPNGTVNAATGNLIIDETDYEIDGRGPGLSIGRTYNSLSVNKGIFGYGWHSDAEMNIKSEESYVKFTDEDGTIHNFLKKSDGKFEAPTGVYLELEETKTDYIITDKEQTKIYFDKTTGRIKEIRDAQKASNKTTYTYTNNQLTAITDASGRKLTLEYTDGLVSKITDPKGRTTTFSYQNDLLVSVTNANKETTTYAYNGNKQLSKRIDPISTKEKPVQTVYEYDASEQRVHKITNPKGKTTTFTYDLPKRTLLVTYPRGNKTFYQYNAQANPVKQIDAYAPEKTGPNDNLESRYEYEGNNLVKAWDPKDIGKTATEAYTYDKNGNVLTATDSYGKETYQYNKNNDVTEVVDTEGEKTTVAYDGLNPISETDEAGNVSSVSSYDQYGNEIQSSAALSATNNLISNSSFEGNHNNWTVRLSKDSGTASVVTLPEKEYQALGGKRAVKLTSNSTTKGSELGYAAITQDIPVEPNQTYTFSADMKTQNLKNAKAFLNVQQLNGNTRVQWNDNRYSALNGTQPWTKRQVTFKTASNVNKVRLYLEIDHNHPTTSGEAWFDRIQLEKADVSSSYNPILNSGFENGLTNWSKTTGTATIDQTNAYDGKASLKMARTAAQDGIQYKQVFNIHQATDSPKPFTVTAMSRSSKVTNTKENTPNKDYAIWVKVLYADGTSEDKQAMFPLGTQEWNRAAVYIQPTKAVQSVEIYPTFKGNNSGTVWFDSIRLIEGNILSSTVYDEKKNYAETVTDVLNRKTQSKYDEVGNLIQETDAKGHKKTYTYDANDELKKVDLPNASTVSYDYDKNGNNTKKTIGVGEKKQLFSYAYDEDNKVTSVVDPLNHKTSYAYDDNDNLVETTLPNGQVIKNTYDQADRIDNIYYNNDLAFEFVKDKNDNETVIVDKRNQLKKEQGFDAKNRMTSQVMKKNNDTIGTVTWKYPNDSDKLESTKFSHGGTEQTTSYSYNKLEQNTAVKNNQRTFRLDYDELGNVTTYSPDNGVGTTYVYDRAGQVISMSTNKAESIGEMTTIIDETYTYDANGNRTEVLSHNGKKETFAYDQMDQLIRETKKDGSVNEYKYDGFGNRIYQKIGNKEAVTSTYNIQNQLTAYGKETIKYDQNGNRIEDGTYTYEWNAADQLVAVTKKGESTPFAEYKYDDDGRRIQKKVKGTITNYIYDGDSLNVLYETNAKDQVQRSYVYSAGGQLLALNKHNGNKVSDTYYYHYNPRGDVIALTDQSGNVVASYEYDSWGNPQESKRTGIALENPFRYAGYHYDEETGLYYLIARYYHPTHSVFLSLDPDPGDDDDILTQNGYTYANNNPVMLVDPDGEWAWAAVGGVIGGVSAYRAAKRKGKRGWRLVGATVGGAAFGAVGGRYLKLLNRAYRAKKYTGKATFYKNVTKKGARVRNINTNISIRSFQRNLKKSGYKKSRTKTKRIYNFSKGRKRYSVRPYSKSRGATAEYFPKGKGKATLKIRLK
ncbi:DNRLRE domain-containing protein [Cerasibacillus sp. JNUCC 74]